MEELRIGEELKISIGDKEYEIKLLPPTPYDETVMGMEMMEITKMNDEYQQLIEKGNLTEEDKKRALEIARDTNNKMEKINLDMLEKIVVGGDKSNFINAVKKNGLAVYIVPKILNAVKKSVLIQ
jgi:hypothetical protein